MRDHSFQTPRQVNQKLKFVGSKVDLARRFSPGAASSSHCSGVLRIRVIVVEKFPVVDAEGRMQP